MQRRPVRRGLRAHRVARLDGVLPAVRRRHAVAHAHGDDAGAQRRGRLRGALGLRGLQHDELPRGLRGLRLAGLGGVLADMRLGVQDAESHGDNAGGVWRGCLRCDFGHGRLQHSGLHRQLCDDKLECVVGMHRDVWIGHSAKNPLRLDVTQEQRGAVR